MRMLALACIPIIALSGCAMVKKSVEPVAYQAPSVAKPAPVKNRASLVRRATPPAAKPVKPVLHVPNPDGGNDPW